MTPLFICRSVPTYLMAHIAVELKRRNKLEECYTFHAYYDGWKDIFSEQSKMVPVCEFGTADIFKAIPGTEISAGELERIEQLYGVSDLWNIIFTEWALVPYTHYKLSPPCHYSKNDKTRYLVACVQYFENMLDNHPINCVIDFAMPSIFRGVLSAVCERRRIPYLFTTHSQIGDWKGADRYYINCYLRDPQNFLDQRLEQLSANPERITIGRHYLEKYRTNTLSSAYNSYAVNRVVDRTIGQRLKLLAGVTKGYALAPYFELKKRLLAARHAEYRYNFHFLKSLFSVKIQAKIRAVFRRFVNEQLMTYDSFLDLDKTRPYAVFTMHVQPEASTTVLAPFEVDQISILHNIARALPLNWQLVVKVHPLMLGQYPPAELRKIKAIPNLRLVDKQQPVRELLNNCSAVVTITGTSGLEGALLGKPVAFLGDETIGWRRLKNVIQIKRWRDLSAFFRNCHQIEFDQSHTEAFLESVHDNSFGLADNYIWYGPFDMQHDGYRKGVNALTDLLICRYDAVTEIALPTSDNVNEPMDNAS